MNSRTCGLNPTSPVGTFSRWHWNWGGEEGTPGCCQNVPGLFMKHPLAMAQALLGLSGWWGASQRQPWTFIYSQRVSDPVPTPGTAARPAARSPPVGTGESVWKKNGECPQGVRRQSTSTSSSGLLPLAEHKTDKLADGLFQDSEGDGGTGHRSSLAWVNSIHPHTEASCIPVQG